MTFKIVFPSVFLALLILWLVAFLSLHFESHEYAKVSSAQAEEAKDYLEGKLLDLPEAWQWQEFVTEAGVSLRAGMLEAEQPKAMVLVVPGFTGMIEFNVDEIVQLHQAGFSVASIEYRGQGGSHRPLSHPEKGYVEDYVLLADELAQYIDSIRYAGKPFFVYGISMGGHISMRMALEQKTDIDAFALIVPMIKINTGAIPYEATRLLAKAASLTGLSAFYAPGQKAFQPEDNYTQATACNSNPDTAHMQSAFYALNEPMRTRGVTLQWLHETIESSDKLLTPSYNETIEVPVLMFTAGIDHLVDSDAAQRFCSDLSQCELQHYESSYHCITEENKALYNGIIADVIHFYGEQAHTYFEQNAPQIKDATSDL